MSGILSVLAGIKTAIATAVDEYFNRVTLLLPGDGTNGAQNNTFLDSSTNNFTITRNGNTTQGTFSPFSQTGWGNFFNGAGNYITSASNAVLGFGTGDFTVECWVYITAFPDSQFVWDFRTTNTETKPYLYVTTSGGLVFGVGASTPITGGTVTANTWHHLALSRASGTTRLFLNGTQVGSNYTDSNNYGTTGRVNVSGAGDNVAVLGVSGYISNFRATKSGGLYTGSFTVPTAALTTTVSAGSVSLLMCQSNRFVDNSANALALTIGGTPSVQAFSPFAPTAAYSAATNGGSGYFDGTGDYASVAGNAAFALPGDFTVECWVYMTLRGNHGAVFTVGTVSDGVMLRIGNTVGGWNDLFLNGTSIVSGGPAQYFPVNAWNHFAIVRSGSGTNNVSVYVNGVRITQVTNTATVNSANGSIRVASNEYDQHLYGYVSGFRVLKGTAAYSGATITVPTAPQTNVTNTSILLNFTNAGITDATAKNDLETVGNAQISTTQSKFGGSSMYFDGAANTYLSQNPATSDLYAFGSGDFTIECWLYLISTTSIRTLYDSRASGTSSSATPTIYIDAGTIKYYVSGSDRITGSALSTGQWYHIALARSGTSTKMFINGTQAGSTYTDSTVYINSSRRPFIGGDSNSAGSNLLGGYIDDLRITKGYARYTASFTPPTAAFPLS